MGQASNQELTEVFKAISRLLRAVAIASVFLQVILLQAAGEVIPGK